MLYIGANKEMQKTPLAITTTECNVKCNYSTNGNFKSASQNSQDHH
jgi:hypothetical protein